MKTIVVLFIKYYSDKQIKNNMY